jgi:hypothetical protein
MTQAFEPPEWTLVELETTATHKAAPAQPAPPARLRWLANPAHILLELGQVAHGQDRAMQLLGNLGQASTNMQELNERLLGLVKALGIRSHKRNWWTRLTGADLLREASRNNLAADVAQTREFCEEQGVALKTLRETMVAQVQALRRQAAQLDNQATIAAALLGNSEDAARLQAQLGHHDMTRLSKRVDNTRVVVTALGLTASQCELSAGQAQTLQDRFEEIKTVLLPIWQQRLSFENLAQN